MAWTVASTGPRACARGNHLTAEEKEKFIISFNGAARVRARKFNVSNSVPVFSVRASTGPRACARGNGGI